MTNLLVHREDYRSIVFVLITLLLLMLPFAVPVNSPWILPWLLASSLFCFSCCIINHNHVHKPVFHGTRANACFAALLTFAKGHSSAGVILAHNYNHHRHNGDSNDWIRPQLAGASRGLMRLLRFLIAATLSMARGRREAGMSCLSPEIRRQLLRERILLWLLVFALLLLDVETFILFVAIPWAMGITLLIGVNLLQHDGCQSASQYDHSRNFVGSLGNWFFFNNGYHTAHHMLPALHWSQLPDWHNAHVTPAIDKNLEQPSVLRFLFRHYLFSQALPMEKNNENYSINPVIDTAKPGSGPG